MQKPFTSRQFDKIENKRIQAESSNDKFNFLNFTPKIS